MVDRRSSSSKEIPGDGSANRSRQYTDASRRPVSEWGQTEREFGKLLERYRKHLEKFPIESKKIEETIESMKKEFTKAKSKNREEEVINAFDNYLRDKEHMSTTVAQPDMDHIHSNQTPSEKIDTVAGTSRDNGKQKVEEPGPSTGTLFLINRMRKEYNDLLNKNSDIDENIKEEVKKFWERTIGEAKTEKDLKVIIENLEDFLGKNEKNDKRAGTSRDKGKQKVEDQEPRQNNDDIGLQKRFDIVLKEYRLHLKENRDLDEHQKNIILYLCKKEFSKAKNVNEQEKYVEGLADYLRKAQPDKYNSHKQREIDEELGYWLKSDVEKNINGKKEIDQEKVKNIRIKTINFLKEKIIADINKAKNQAKNQIKNTKKIVLRWTSEVDLYFMNQEQLVADEVRRTLAYDTLFINNFNGFGRWRKGGDNRETAYQGKHYEEVANTLKEVYEAIYPTVDERNQQRNQQRREYNEEQVRQNIQAVLEIIRAERVNRQEQRIERVNRQETPESEQSNTGQQGLGELRRRELRNLNPGQLLEYSQLLKQHRPTDQQEQLAGFYEAGQLVRYITDVRRQQPERLSEEILSQVSSNAYDVINQWGSSAYEQRGRELEQQIPELRQQRWEGLISSDLRRISGILKQQQEHMIIERRFSWHFRKNLNSLREHLCQRINSLRVSGRADRYESYGLTLDNLEKALTRTDACLENLRQYDQSRLGELRAKKFSDLTPLESREYCQLFRLDQQRQGSMDRQEQFALWHEADRLYCHLQDMSRREIQNEISEQLWQESQKMRQFMSQFQSSFESRAQDLEQRIPELRQQRWEGLISSDLRRISGILEKQQERMIRERRVSKSLSKTLKSLHRSLDQRIKSLQESKRADRYESYGLTFYNLERALTRTNKCLQKLSEYNDYNQQQKRREMLKQCYSLLRMCVGRPRVSE